MRLKMTKFGLLMIVLMLVGSMLVDEQVKAATVKTKQDLTGEGWWYDSTNGFVQSWSMAYSFLAPKGRFFNSSEASGSVTIETGEGFNGTFTLNSIHFSAKKPTALSTFRVTITGWDISNGEVGSIVFDTTDEPADKTYSDWDEYNKSLSGLTGVSKFTITVEKLSGALRDFTLMDFTINGINYTPTNIALSKANVRQSQGVNAVVGSLSTSDQNGGSGFDYSFVSGVGDSDNENFNLSGDQLMANNASRLAAGDYSVRIRSTDSGGLYVEKSFSIAVEDDVPPDFLDGFPSLSGITTDSAILTVQLNAAGTVYYAVVNDEATEPASSQVRAGHVHEDAEAKVHGSIRVDEAGAGFADHVDLSGLKPLTDYDLYAVAEDEAGNLQASAMKIDFTTLNHVPVAAEDSYNTDEDTVLTVGAPGVLANDTDADHDTLTAVIADDPSHGTLILNADGSFTYTPYANYNGSDSFAYKANDGTADLNVATVNLTVNPVNDAPIAVADDYHTAQDTRLIAAAGDGVLANDSDIDTNHDELLAVIKDGPGNGSLILNADGSFTYTPNAGFFGNDSFTYYVNDGQMSSAAATVSIAVYDNVPPIAPTIGLSRTGWTNSTVTASVYGEVGASIEYRIGVDSDAGWQSYTGPLLFDQEGEYRVFARQTDASGNLGEMTAQATIQIDKTAPILTLIGDAEVSIYDGSSFTDPGVEVSDNYAAGLTATVTGSVYANKVGDYVLRYSAVDLAGNAAETKTRVVHVVAKPTGLRFDQPAYKLKVGETVPFSVVLTYSDTHEERITALSHYTFDPTGIASLASAGLISGDRAGMTVLTAVYGSQSASVNVEVSALNANADLIGIALSSGTLSPTFSADQTNYSVSVGNAVKDIIVTANAASGLSAVSMDGAAATAGAQSASIALHTGHNNIDIVVTAEDGSAKTYHLEIVRAASSGNDDNDNGNRYEGGSGGANIGPDNVIAEDDAQNNNSLTIEREKAEQNKPEPPRRSFNDMDGHWAERSVKEAVEKGFINGYPGGAFKPNHSVTRAEFVVMLVRTLHLEDGNATLLFTDNDQIGGWAESAVALAVQAGIIAGYDDGSFRPDAKITRAEMAAIIARAMRLPAGSEASTGFADDADVPVWAKGAVEEIRKLGIVSGHGGNQFIPNDTATRAEAAVILLRVSNRT